MKLRLSTQFYKFVNIILTDAIPFFCKLNIGWKFCIRIDFLIFSRIISNIRCATLVSIKDVKKCHLKLKITKDAITNAALSITKESGVSGLTARTLAAKLGCSFKPIFGLFKNMEEVQQEVLRSANDLCQSYLVEDMKSGKYPPYKASGMAYIRFSKEEKELFKLLFMRNRTYENIDDDKDGLKPLLNLIQQKSGLNEASGYLFHLEMWIYVHGIATMLATSYLNGTKNLLAKWLQMGMRD